MVRELDSHTISVLPTEAVPCACVHECWTESITVAVAYMLNNGTCGVYFPRSGSGVLYMTWQEPRRIAAAHLDQTAPRLEYNASSCRVGETYPCRANPSCGGVGRTGVYVYTEQNGSCFVLRDTFSPLDRQSQSCTPPDVAKSIPPCLLSQFDMFFCAMRTCDVNIYSGEDAHTSRGMTTVAPTSSRPHPASWVSLISRCEHALKTDVWNMGGIIYVSQSLHDRTDDGADAGITGAASTQTRTAAPDTSDETDAAHVSSSASQHGHHTAKVVCASSDDDDGCERMRCVHNSYANRWFVPHVTQIEFTCRHKKESACVCASAGEGDAPTVHQCIFQLANKVKPFHLSAVRTAYGVTSFDD